MKTFCCYGNTDVPEIKFIFVKFDVVIDFACENMRFRKLLIIIFVYVQRRGRANGHATVFNY